MLLLALVGMSITIGTVIWKSSSTTATITIGLSHLTHQVLKLGEDFSEDLKNHVERQDHDLEKINDRLQAVGTDVDQIKGQLQAGATVIP